MSVDYKIEIEKLENLIKHFKEQERIHNTINFPILNIDTEYIEKMRKEKRWFLPGDEDYEESLKHPMGIPKEHWYIPKKDVTPH